MNALTTHTKRMVGVSAVIGVLAAFTAQSALAEPAYSTADRTGGGVAYQSDPQVSGIERQLFPAQNGGSVKSSVVANQVSDPQVSGLERQLFPSMSHDSSVLRDRSTDRGGVSPVQYYTASTSTSDDGIGWAQVGIGAAALLGLTFLLASFTVHRGRQEPKSA